MAAPQVALAASEDPVDWVIEPSRSIVLLVISSTRFSVKRVHRSSDGYFAAGFEFEQHSPRFWAIASPSLGLGNDKGTSLRIHPQTAIRLSLARLRIACWLGPLRFGLERYPILHRLLDPFMSKLYGIPAHAVSVSE